MTQTRQEKKYTKTREGKEPIEGERQKSKKSKDEAC
jgi:hypothetical protein